MNILVTKRDGTQESFNANQINKSIERACAGLTDPISKVVQIATEMRLMLYSGITSEELDHATINAALQNIQEDVEYDQVATRLLLKTVYKRILGEYEEDTGVLQKLHQAAFIEYIQTNVQSGLLDPRMKKSFDIKKLAATLDLGRDELFQYAGLSTLLDRYALKDSAQKPLETPQLFFMRVAMGLAFNEPDPTQAAITFYESMSKLEYIAGGSTNIGAGTVKPALSNCFLLEIQDDIEHIAKSVSDVIKISKATGGIGASVTKLRASGSPLSSNNTTSSGPTPFAKIIDTAIRAIQRGGKKKGALCFYMENWHVDFPEFLNWKHNAGDDYLRMRTADTAVWLSDEFMRRVKSGGMWYMFDPHETPDLNELYGEAFDKRYKEYIEMAEAGKLRLFKKAPAEEQFRQILVMLQATSHPWLTWKDAVNTRALNNNTGTIHMSNLCTEICLPQDRENIAVCNLASLNLVRHFAGGKMDWAKLEKTVRLAVRHLDNLIDINILPIPEAAKSDSENRAVGLGVMGFAELLEMHRLAYDSEAAYELADKVFEFISYTAIDESANLAKARGSYTHFKGSQWAKGKVPFDTIENLEEMRGIKLSVAKKSHSKELGIDWDGLRKKVKKGMRNATLMAVAPNANIGLLAGTTPGIDPRFAQVFSRNKISGKYLDINHHLVQELVDLKLWENVRQIILERQGDISEIEEIPQEMRSRYKSAFTTAPEAFIEVAARAQKWVDQALSRNMYLETRNIDDLLQIYTLAWQKGLKTTYYLHMKPRHTAEQSTVTVNKGDQIGKVGFGALKAMAAGAAASGATTATVAVSSLTGSVVASASLPPTNTALSPEKARLAMTASPTNVIPACPIDPQERLLCDSCQ